LFLLNEKKTRRVIEKEVNLISLSVTEVGGVMNCAKMVKCLGLSLFLLLGGCYNFSVSSDSDPSIDRSRYVFYAWSSAADSAKTVTDPAYNPFFHNRVRMAVDRELASRGFRLKTQGKVDFIVAVRIWTDLAGIVYQEPSFYFPRRFYRGHPFRHDLWGDSYGSYPYVGYVEQNTLAIDVTDAFTNQPAWRGTARGVARNYADTDRMQGEIDRAVSRVFDLFVPLKKGK